MASDWYSEDAGYTSDCWRSVSVGNLQIDWMCWRWQVALDERDRMLSATGGLENQLTTSDGHDEGIDCPQTLKQRLSLADNDTTLMTTCETDCAPTTSALTTEQTSNCDAAAVTESLIPGSAPPRTLLFRRRWLIIFLFASYSMSNAYQWIHLNIIFDKVCVSVTSMLFYIFLHIVVIPLTQYCSVMLLPIIFNLQNQK